MQTWGGCHGPQISEWAFCGFTDDDGTFFLLLYASKRQSKLFNGSVWKRAVVKYQNRVRVSMHHTCLRLCMAFRIEEWREFLSNGALGMQSRFLTFHSSPRLDKAAAALDADVYQAAKEEAPIRAPSLLQQFVQVLRYTEWALRWRVYSNIFPKRCVGIFLDRFDQQVLQQEISYFQDPKKFSHARELKSLPWRLAIPSHCWGHACSRVNDADSQWAG